MSDKLLHISGRNIFNLKWNEKEKKFKLIIIIARERERGREKERETQDKYAENGMKKEGSQVGRN